MAQDDYEAVLEKLKEELRSVDAEDIADEGSYRDLDEDTGDLILPDPQELLVRMLEAFGRRLAAEDGATYSTAVEQIRRVTFGDRLEGADFQATDGSLVELEKAPDLSSVRQDLREFVKRIRDTPLEPLPRYEP